MFLYAAYLYELLYFKHFKLLLLPTIFPEIENKRIFQLSRKFDLLLYRSLVHNY